MSSASVRTYLPNVNLVELLEAKLGYAFSVKGLLIEALTHPSQQEAGATYCYQAPPTNLSGSSSSSSVAPMPKRKNGAGSSRSSPHMWTDEEEWTLLAEIRELLKTQPLVIKKRVKFYESLAGMMNKKFAGKDGYVVLTASKIRTKLLHYKESFSTRAPMSWSAGLSNILLSAVEADVSLCT
ncbi:hypothetical protein ZEAMMB73_Zm00001d033627 [Zea mays]|uniref:Uncharacterized protein n=1 Tax=Zea mays TaxID=4577 RepID=A0A1D6L0W5_MAIZE|nr:hypothetical protein ZEAMMB73_Zm00001d033627 [Zea mays]